MAFVQAPAWRRRLLPRNEKNRATREEWRGFQIPVVLVEYLAHGKLKNHDQGSKPNQDATDQGFDGELLV